MCDVVGVRGMLRIHQYSLKYNKPFFDKNIFTENEIIKLTMPNDFIESDTKGLISKTTPCLLLFFPGIHHHLPQGNAQ